jgi:hypothetical protein
MAIKVAVHRICDRCAHPFDEATVKYGAELPKFHSKHIAAVLREVDASDPKETVLFLFEDLCPDCDRVVEGYIKKIRLDEEEVPKKKSKKGDKPVEAVEAVDSGQVPPHVTEGGLNPSEILPEKPTPSSDVVGSEKAASTLPY